MQNNFKTRRTFNRTAAGATGLATLSYWARPAMEVIVLPAHAQMSSNLAPVLNIENPAPEIFDIIISDDTNNFDYSIEIFTVEDTSGNTFNPPILRESIVGNSGSSSSISITTIVTSASTDEFRITATDSVGAQSSAVFVAVSP